jgi:hypothetical protein
VPRVRFTADYRRNHDVLKPVPTFTSIPGGSLAAPYLRWHPPLPGMYDDSQPPEYDVDETDEVWLEKANTVAAAGEGGGGDTAGAGRGGGAGRSGLMAAARGLVATLSNSFRARGGSDAGGTPRASDAGGSGAGGTAGAAAAAGGGPLGILEFERAIEKLELLHFAAVGKWWSDLNDGGLWVCWPGRRISWPEGSMCSLPSQLLPPCFRRALPSVSAPGPRRCSCPSPRLSLPGPSTSAPTQAPKIPATKHLLPKMRAVEELSELVPDKRIAGQLYDHWLKRRQQHGGPLLERLWFEVRSPRRGGGRPLGGLVGVAARPCCSVH